MPGLILTFVGGYFDAYTYLTRGGVFANAQTGNIVLLSLEMARGRFWGAAYYFLPILAFFIGVLLSEWLRLWLSERGGLRWMHAILLIEILLVFLIGFVPTSVPHALVNVTVSLICSLQVNTFRKIRGMPYATTMCTGNLRSATESLCTFLFAKDRVGLNNSLCYFYILGMFCIGCILGAWLTIALGIRSIWVCGILLLLALVLIHEKKG